VSITPYVLYGASGSIQLNLSSGRLDPFTHCLSILFIAFPLCPRKRLTTLSVNAAPDEGRRPASGALPPGRVLHRGPGLSSPGALLEGPWDAPRSFPSSMYRQGCFLCVSQGRRRSSSCLSDVSRGGVAGPPLCPSPDGTT
jgi:hypothetical protein